MEFKNFNTYENETWKILFERQAAKRTIQLADVFSEGLEKLGMTSARIPDLKDVNSRLKKLTGFEAVPVEGYVESKDFYPMLGRRQYPVGNFIRERDNLAYTPAPDVFHDLYGHVPFFADAKYAEFSADFGQRAGKFRDQPEKLREWERLYWFTAEFGLVKTPKGKRIFGAGIASSFAECAYALSDEPEVLPYDCERIRFQEFKIDELQKRIFVLNSAEELYSSLDAFEKGMTA